MPRPTKAACAPTASASPIVASRFNDFMVDKLIEGALDALRRSGAADDDVELFRCPGAFEIPALLRRWPTAAASTASICLGVVIRGATPHFDLVVRRSHQRRRRASPPRASWRSASACWPARTSSRRSSARAARRGNRGFDAAMVAIEMADLFADERWPRAKPA